MPDRTPQKGNKQPDADGFAPGTVVLEKYEIQACIGAGSKTVVYKVLHTFTKQEFALKVYTGVYGESREQRFQTEARATSRLDHENIARSLDCGLIDRERPFCLMEYVQGETLADYLKRCGRLTFDDIIAVFIPLAWALQYAHENGVVHCAIKPSNIMLVGEQGNWQCKLLDFGGAKVLEDKRAMQVHTGDVLENPLYMSPEQCSGKPVDARTDIYSLGCTIFEAITATPPFNAQSRSKIVKMHLNDKPPTLKEASLGRDFPPTLESIVSTMLEKEPEKRFSSATQVAENLMRLKMGTQVVTPASQSEARRRNPIDFWHIAIFASVVVLVCGLIYVMSQSKPIYVPPTYLQDPQGRRLELRD